jgi:hypothetical protein
MTRGILLGFIVTIFSLLSSPNLGFCPVFMELNDCSLNTIYLNENEALLDESSKSFCDIVSSIDSTIDKFPLEPNETLFLDPMENSRHFKISANQKKIFKWVQNGKQSGWQKLQAPIDKFDVIQKKNFYKTISIDKSNNIFIGAGDDEYFSNLEKFVMFNNKTGSWNLTKSIYYTNTLMTKNMAKGIDVNLIQKPDIISGNFDGIIIQTPKPNPELYNYAFDSTNIEYMQLTEVLSYAEQKTKLLPVKSLFTIKGKPYVLTYFGEIYEIKLEENRLEYTGKTVSHQKTTTNFNETVDYLTKRIFLDLTKSNTDKVYTLNSLKEYPNLFNYIFDSLKIRLEFNLSSNKDLIKELIELKQEIDSKEKITYKINPKEKIANETFLNKNPAVASEQNIAKENKESIEAKIKKLEEKINKKEDELYLLTDNKKPGKIKNKATVLANEISLLKKDLIILEQDLKIEIPKPEEVIEIKKGIK